MSLQRLTCDRCQRFSGALFRLVTDLDKVPTESNWFCPNCMRLMGEPLQGDISEIMEWLKDQWSNEPMKNLDRELEAIRREEEFRAGDRQAEAGIDRPVKLSFSEKLPPELDLAIQRLWDAGCSKDGLGPTDVHLRKLWIQINRGTSCLSKADFIAFSKLKPEQMRKLAPGLTEGETLAEAQRKLKR